MQLIEAIRQRSSTAPITDEAPSDDRVRQYLAIAAHAPDHAGLRPWRLVIIRGAARQALGEAWAAGFGDRPGSPEATKTAAKPLRAPLLIAVVAAPVPHPKVPRWEQIAAAAAMVTTLELVLFDAGWTAFWRSGPAVDLTPVRELLAVSASEQLLGWLYVGGTAGTDGVRADPDVGDRITVLSVGSPSTTTASTATASTATAGTKTAGTATAGTETAGAGQAP